ncbi:Ifu5 predicted membrane protein [Candida orthopsilosis Co 90-125]|uniref:Ifu5 predicted membrane protein n=1 Tax=Candida orthopsilosis (strain 90-125) TaxID=1136231 RepID=H8WVL1_CANO9|nr:Ifu5 predicted membrane protein [Candida orthopsilosis Co 90-125]CCG20484.1 Ifu5 predicted membrane protein [Candida orthopsilosis Co 90-125]
MAKDDPNKPPTIPSGWLAKFDDKYKTWFYVDLSTKKSQWDAPKGTVFDKDDDVPPPAYSPTASKAGTASPNSSKSSVPAKDEQGKGLFNRHQQQAGYGGAGGVPPRAQYPSQPGYGGYPPQQGFGGYPPQGYGGYPPQGYGGYPPQGYGQYPPQQQQQRSRFGGGAGNMALGVGGGLLGGMLLGSAINDWDDHERMEGYQDGYQDGYDNGGDYGGGDFGGGDFGGGDF